MKKIIYSIILGIAIFATSCEYNEVNFDDLDIKSQPVNVLSLEGSLTADQYATLSKNALKKANNASDSSSAKAIATDLALNKTWTASQLFPQILNTLYYTVDDGSSYVLTYNLNSGTPDYISDYENATLHTLTQAEYARASSDAGLANGFYPNQSAGSYIPTILSELVSNPTTEQIARVQYNQYTTEPEIGYTTIFEENFDSGLGAFSAYSITGDQTWFQSSYGNDTYAKMSGYSGGAIENEDWLISTQIDLTDKTNVILNINQAAKYVNDTWEYLTLHISTDFDGTNVSAAGWTKMQITNLPTGNDYVFVQSENIDLSAFEGKKIFIAVKYLSSATTAATWEVNSITVKALGITGNYKTKNEFYKYNGTKWVSNSKTAFILTADEYDSMGAPGNYDNFSSSILPQNYLPRFLANKYPYSQEGDTVLIGYKYYASGSTNLVVDQYKYSSGVWAEKATISQVTEQFVYSKTAKGWVFDPTIKITMGAADFQIIVDYVKQTHGTDYIDGYGTAEYYHGASAYYKNFDIRSGKFDASFASWQDAIIAALKDAYLPNKFPQAVTQVNGIDMHYIITFNTYIGTYDNYSANFQCTSSAPNLQFTYIDGSLKKQ